MIVKLFLRKLVCIIIIIIFLGQQLIRLSDGRLQLLTLPTVQQAQTEQPAVQTAQATPSVQLPTIRPAISLAQTATASTGNAVATLTSAAASTPMSLSMPAVANIAAPGTIQLVQGQTTQIKVLGYFFFSL